MRLSLIAVVVPLAITPFKVSSVAEGASGSLDQRLDANGRHRELIVRARNINTRLAQQRPLDTRHRLSPYLGAGRTG